MATYLYCVRGDYCEVPAGLAGIDGAPVRSIEASSLIAWVSDARETPVTVTVDRVKEHDAVCAAALDVGDTPLPIRFGQTFADDDAAVEALLIRRTTLQSRLARVTGSVELRIVVTRGRETVAGDADLDDPVAAAVDGPETMALEGPGTAFLRRLARAGRADTAREVGCEEVRHAVRTAAKDLLVDQQPCEGARGVSFFPVLVRRDAVGDLRAAIAELLSSQAIELSVLGPFAPYSFAGDA